jgi:uncharacterized protein (TIGR03086 family)
MDALPDLHDRALAHTRRYVEAIKADQWHDPTPCDDWDVRQVLNHIVEGNLWVGALMGGRTIEEVGDELEGDQLGDDPTSAYARSADAASRGFQAPGAMAQPVPVSYGPVPGEVYAGHRFIDVLIHGWDLAKGTGQDSVLEPELVEACWAVVEPQKEIFAQSGAFGDDHEAPEDADPQTRLLAALGRKP